MTEWKPYPASPAYLVSNTGLVYSKKRGIFLKPVLGTTGYYKITMYYPEGIKKTVLIHKIVAETFHGPRLTPKHEVNHKSGIKADNNSDNLEWTTSSENKKHAFKMGLRVRPYGTLNPSSILGDDDVRAIRTMLNSGMSVRYVSQISGMSDGAIKDIRNGRTWSWLQ